MENRAHALVAGLFVISLSVAAMFVATWFNGDVIKRSDYLVVTNESVTGLNSQAAVHYRGVNIGKVESIRFNPDNLNQILINISVDENIMLTKSVYAQLGYQGVTGLAYVQLNDDGSEPERLQHDAQIPMRRSLFEEVAGSGQDLLSNVNELVKKMHLLLSEKNQAQFSNILKNIEKATGQFDETAKQLQPVFKSFSGLTTETESVVGHLDQLLLEIRHITARVNQQGGIMDNLSQSTEELAAAIPELHKISDGVTRSTYNLDRVLRQVEENPQSLLFGSPPPLPGPGEYGFISP
ncbi:phospholipid/cholesterol/gamma-HCH transport system substrate-binding protein [Nitrosomonas cryotolerans]|uniref:Phospholipid/cholesterol/gamma-HCH transport system substrate-binding protein n=1 Tax=Nitrosomonas cryotolerans ATCC 49181 TaxID=1131553 RepID=A0A1N6INP7_9PROT|nr:MlaD family protein [Nitrosomonas cryotolerans]SFP35883.1 phospholipid/cholesterol/gamma-HCH transport system substrate-binding protein [Nitrosomonas cryotolerans]SIO33603.1 phospholipid/cholesterol/gamma-HCH transport system substrate-binding protein [Nitrosomonas cryotolerans ATCC 49181]